MNLLNKMVVIIINDCCLLLHIVHCSLLVVTYIIGLVLFYYSSVCHLQATTYKYTHFHLFTNSLIQFIGFEWLVQLSRVSC